MLAVCHCSESYGKAEWMLSLSNAVADYAVSAGMVAGAVATIGVALTALWSAAEWIDQFGAAGWILAAFAAVLVCTFLAGTVAWIWNNIRTVAMSGSLHPIGHLVNQFTRNGRVFECRISVHEAAALLLPIAFRHSHGLRDLDQARKICGHGALPVSHPAEVPADPATA